MLNEVAYLAAGVAALTTFVVGGLWTMLPSEDGG